MYIELVVLCIVTTIISTVIILNVQKRLLAGGITAGNVSNTTRLREPGNTAGIVPFNATCSYTLAPRFYV